MHSCARPSTTCTATPGANSATQRSNSARAAAFAIGATNAMPGRCDASHAMVAANGGASRVTSPIRLPGSTATTCADPGTPSAARARGLVARHLDAVRKRMADELRLHVVRSVEIHLERQHAQHEIDGLPDRAHPTLSPGPHLRADVLDGRHAPGLHLASHAQVELGRIDADESIGGCLCQAADQVAAQREQARQVPDDLRETHDREFLDRVPGLATRGNHARTRDSEETGARGTGREGLDQWPSKIVARSLARDEREGSRLRSLVHAGCPLSARCRARPAAGTRPAA